MKRICKLKPLPLLVLCLSQAQAERTLTAAEAANICEIRSASDIASADGRRLSRDNRNTLVFLEQFKTLAEGYSQQFKEVNLEDDFQHLTNYIISAPNCKGENALCSKYNLSYTRKKKNTETLLSAGSASELTLKNFKNPGIVSFFQQYRVNSSTIESSAIDCYHTATLPTEFDSEYAQLAYAEVLKSREYFKALDEKYGILERVPPKLWIDRVTYTTKSQDVLAGQDTTLEKDFEIKITHSEVNDQSPNSERDNLLSYQKAGTLTVNFRGVRRNSSEKWRFEKINSYQWGD